MQWSTSIRTHPTAWLSLPRSSSLALRVRRLLAIAFFGKHADSKPSGHGRVSGNFPRAKRYPIYLIYGYRQMTARVACTCRRRIAAEAMYAVNLGSRSRFMLSRCLFQPFLNNIAPRAWLERDLTFILTGLQTCCAHLLASVHRWTTNYIVSRVVEGVRRCAAHMGVEPILHTRTSIT